MDWLIGFIIFFVVVICVSAVASVLAAKNKRRNGPQYQPRVETTQVQSFSQVSAPYPQQNLPYPTQHQNMPQPPSLPSSNFYNNHQAPVGVMIQPIAMPVPSNSQNFYPPSTSQAPSDPPPPYNPFIGSSEESNTKTKY